MIWIQFIISAGLIVVAGVRLTHYADYLGDKFNISKVWIGLLLLGIVTSLPEAVTSLTAVISLKSADMAIGNVLGSNNFNPMIVVILDLMYRKGSLTNSIKRSNSQILSAILAIILSIVVIADIYLSRNLGWIRMGYMSIGTILIAVVYLLGIRTLTAVEAHPVGSVPVQAREVESSLNRVLFNMIFSAGVVILGAVWLANTGDVIAERTGLGQMFVGTLFLAFVTSLPEIVVSLTALKLGSLDMAFGNIFGSNMINLFVVFLCGVFYFEGPILAVVSMTHVLTLILSIVLVGILLIGINLNNKKTILGLGWDSVLMSACFLVGMKLIYNLR